MRGERGELSFLFGSWGAVDRAEAIRQIESGERTYILQRQDGSHARFSVVGEGESKRLTAFAHGSDLVRVDLAGRLEA
jgi:hypothetical protein